MGRLKDKYDLLAKALNRLGYIVDQFNKICTKDYCPTEDNLYTIHRDALIQRFEFSYDLFWKFLKQYLEEKLGILEASPKKVFQACLDQKIINNNEAGKLAEMVEARNYTSHIYSDLSAIALAKAEDMANKTALLVKEYYQLMNSIIKRLEV